MAAKIACVITCELNGVQQVIVLDNVEDTSIQERSTLTMHPVASGDMIADHMYNEAATISIRGKFADNGNPGFLLNGQKLSLREIEDYFTEIRKSGTLCTVVKAAQSGSDFSFRKLDFCALTSTSWTEEINTLGFEFSFTKVLLAETEVHQVDVEDENLPNLTELISSNFTNTLMDWTYVDAAVIKCGLDAGFITQDFLDSFSKNTVVSAAVSTFAAGVGIAIAAVNAVPAVGQIITIIVAGLIAIGAFVWGIYNTIHDAVLSKKFRYKKFDAYKDDKKKQEEDARFINFMGDIHKAMLDLNNAIRVYQISVNEPQEALVNIDNDYYIFSFEKNNIAVPLARTSFTETWKLKVTGATDKITYKEMPDIRSSPVSYFECTCENKLFSTPEMGTWVYLIRVPLELIGESEGGRSYSGGSGRLEGFSTISKEGWLDLTNYLVVTSSFDPQEFDDKIVKIVLDTVTM